MGGLTQVIGPHEEFRAFGKSGARGLGRERDKGEAELGIDRKNATHETAGTEPQGVGRELDGLFGRRREARGAGEIGDGRAAGENKGCGH